MSKVAVVETENLRSPQKTEAAAVSVVVKAADCADCVPDVVRRLKAGECGVLPTETVHGLMGSAMVPETEARLRRMKKRAGEKPFQRLIGWLEDLEFLLITPSDLLLQLAAAFWPGPLTVVVQNRNGVAIGVRSPDHPLILAVLQQLGGPLVATSANRSGILPDVSLAGAFSDLAEPPDFVVVDPAIQGNTASTVVRLGQEIEILRDGAIASDVIFQVLAGSHLPKGALKPGRIHHD